MRGDAGGWRTNDGIMIFGGWGTDGDKADVRLIDNQFQNAGKSRVIYVFYIDYAK